MNRRSDSLSASLVDAAIYAAAVHGSVSAAKDLVDAGIPWEVVMRVLKRPADRRTYSRPAAGPIREA